MDTAAVKTAYTVFPMPDAKEFWAAYRAGNLLSLKASVFGPGVTFRTKYKTKSAYQYFTVIQTGGYKEATDTVFNRFVVTAAPPVVAVTAPAPKPEQVIDTKPLKLEPEPEQDPVTPVPPVAELSRIGSVVDVPVLLDPVCCPHCKQVFSLRPVSPRQGELAINVALAPAGALKADDALGAAALEAVNAAIPVESAPAEVPVVEPEVEAAVEEVKPEPAVEAVSDPEAAPVADPTSGTLGLRYICVPGADLSLADIEAVESLVRKGAARSQDLLERLRASKGIALAFKDDTVVACLGYQNKPEEYITKTNRKAESTIPKDALELSWIRVSADFTGSHRDEVIVNMYEALRALKANNAGIAGKVVYAVYNTSDVEGYAAMELLGMRKHDREHDGLTKKAQLFLS